MEVKRITRIVELANRLNDPGDQEATRQRRLAAGVVNEIAAGGKELPVPSAEPLKHRYPAEIEEAGEDQDCPKETVRPVHKIA